MVRHIERIQGRSDKPGISRSDLERAAAIGHGNKPGLGANAKTISEIFQPPLAALEGRIYTGSAASIYPGILH